MWKVQRYLMFKWIYFIYFGLYKLILNFMSATGQNVSHKSWLDITTITAPWLYHIFQPTSQLQFTHVRPDSYSNQFIHNVPDRIKFPPGFLRYCVDVDRDTHEVTVTLAIFACPGTSVPDVQGFPAAWLTLATVNNTWVTLIM